MTPAYKKKHLAMVIPPASEMNVMPTSPQVSRFTAMPRPEPCACSHSGRISALYVFTTDPYPTEYVATTASTDARHAAAAGTGAGGQAERQGEGGRGCRDARGAGEEQRRRPTWLVRSMPTRMKHVLTAPMATVAPMAVLEKQTTVCLNSELDLS